MSTVSPPITSSATVESRLPYGGLLRSEIRRLRMRRLVVLFFLLYLVAMVGVMAISFLGYNGNDSATAEAFRDQRVAECQGYVTQDPSSYAPGENPCQFQSPQQVAIDYGELYDANAQVPDGFTGAMVTSAVLAFFIGATFIGAEWSSRTLPGLMTWEPRRLRLLSAKLLALLLGVTVVGVVAQAVFLGCAAITTTFVGTYANVTDTGHFWTLIVERGLRGILLVWLFAVAGFAIAALLRYTAAALGFAFGYLVLGEILLRQTVPRATQWLVSENALALLHDGPRTITLYLDTNNGFGSFNSEKVTYVLSNLRGGLFLAAGSAVLLVLACAVVRRRDIT